MKVSIFLLKNVSPKFKKVKFFKINFNFHLITIYKIKNKNNKMS